MARSAVSSAFHFSLSLSKRFFPSSRSASAFAAATSSSLPSFRSLGLSFRLSNSYSLKPFSSQSSAAAHVEDPFDTSDDSVEDLLTRRKDRIERMMKMERRSESEGDAAWRRWFPYRDVFRSGSMALGSREVIEALDPYMLDARKNRIQRTIENRSYSLCLVVEGLTDFGNVSAAFRSADALGIQSVHVISQGSSKRCNHL